MSATSTPSADTRGLAGQTVGDTSVCAVNQTQLIYRGYEIADLAAHATFEEVAFLLLQGRLPTQPELEACARSSTRQRGCAEHERTSALV